MTFFANNSAGLELAEEICRAVPRAEQLRYVSTGGEADMYAGPARAYRPVQDPEIRGRLSRHARRGADEPGAVKAANFPLPVPDSAGIPRSVGDDILVAPFNDAEFAADHSEHADDIAGASSSNRFNA